MGRIVGVREGTRIRLSHCLQQSRGIIEVGSGFGRDLSRLQSLSRIVFERGYHAIGVPDRERPAVLPSHRLGVACLADSRRRSASGARV